MPVKNCKKDMFFFFLPITVKNAISYSIKLANPILFKANTLLYSTAFQHSGATKEKPFNIKN